MKICKSIMLPLSALCLSVPAAGTEYSGIQVTPEMLDSKTSKPIPIDITTDQFEARLKEGGSIVLDGNDLVVGPQSYDSRGMVFLALDRIELKNGARIITNGNDLVIFANKVASENGSIISFLKAGAKAPSGFPATARGSDGGDGTDGLNSGAVSIYALSGIDGILKVNLFGQDGGNGGDGAQGRKGQKGARGQDAKDGPLPGECKRGGRGGKRGGKGFEGGSAGSAGSGGDGGFFQLVNVGAAPIPSSSITYSANGGAPGDVGKPGAGGPGGEGGRGGRGSTWCKGGSGGPIGPQGRVGDTPAPSSPGIAGNSSIRNLDMEVIVRTAVIVQERDKNPQ